MRFVSWKNFTSCQEWFVSICWQSHYRLRHIHEELFAAPMTTTGNRLPSRLVPNSGHARIPTRDLCSGLSQHLYQHRQCSSDDRPCYLYSDHAHLGHMMQIHAPLTVRMRQKGRILWITSAEPAGGEANSSSPVFVFVANVFHLTWPCTHRQTSRHTNICSTDLNAVQNKVIADILLGTAAKRGREGTFQTGGQMDSL